ncbi:MAG: Glyoxalase/bleomycin resistance protein/dioxygenase [Solirubrobacterales bacterium]|nr:Glyoxalase/bleomycin resistance protein/dioxygenase [Solirubrobacterales bacterium]
MSERTSYTPGTPCWVELGTPDVEATAAFYGDLFGWEIPELPNSAELGGYRRAKKNGKDVAGVAPLMPEGQPPAWTSYISVEDADATAAAVKEAGGSVIAEPMDVMDLGRMAIFADPTGAVFGIWQPGTFPGAGLVNEPGALAWNELGTRDPDAAKAFYGTVFGWGTRDNDMGEMGTYTEWLRGEDSIGGMMDVSGRLPDEIPAHWLVYFAVENTDAALETAKSSGGGVSFGPIDIPAGRFAIVSDPHGAAFAVIQTPDEAAQR